MIDASILVHATLGLCQGSASIGAVGGMPWNNSVLRICFFFSKRTRLSQTSGAEVCTGAAMEIDGRDFRPNCDAETLRNIAKHLETFRNI